MLLENRVALVTGAAQGLGRGIALALADEGARIVATDILEPGVRETARLIEAQGGQALASVMDVCRDESVEATIEGTIGAFGQLDFLINNAGTIAMSPLLEMSAETSARTLEVNVQGVIRCAQRAAHQMIRQGIGGAMVNVASNAGKVGFPDMADYNASKAAVISLTRSMAAEFAQHGINVNAVCPGAVDTPMLRGVADWLAPRVAQAADTLLESFPPAQLGRLIEPIEVGRVVAFLLSDHARIIRGQAINVDAGVTPY